MALRFQRKDRSRYGKRHKPGQMNKTESKYAELLEARRLSGEIVGWEFESVKFKIADNCYYAPDFQVFFPDGSMEFVDVKGAGPVDDKSTVKMKVAAEKWPMFDWVQEKMRRVKDGGGFERREF